MLSSEFRTVDEVLTSYQLGTQQSLKELALRYGKNGFVSVQADVVIAMAQTISDYEQRLYDVYDIICKINGAQENEREVVLSDIERQLRGELS